MTTGADWGSILREALDQALARRESAIPGARLRVLLQKVAESRGLSYPPEGPKVPFASFLSQYTDVVAVRRRPNQDILVAPASRPELLVDEPAAGDGGPQPGIRRDLFDAFTRISPALRAWYSREDDVVKWSAVSTPPEPTWVQIPAPTIAQAVAARKEFALGLPDGATKTDLLRALESEKPLTAFMNMARLAGLQREWHRFRTTTLVEIIKRWADSHSISWRDSWIATASGEAESAVASVPPPMGARDSTHEWRRAFMFFAQTLDREDLARISIPLDLVLKALTRR
jgi:hypothetical protein